MTAIPAASAIAGPCSVASCPSTSSSPASGWYTPARIFTRGDLPAPFSPTRACTSPAYSSIDPSSIACTAPHDFAAWLGPTDAPALTKAPGLTDALRGRLGVLARLPAGEPSGCLRPAQPRFSEALY